MKKIRSLLQLTMALATVTLSPVQASTLPGGALVPLIVAGAPPDSPANRVDTNTASSPFSGVVSINIRYDGQSFICSGTLVSKRDVVTAGHCVDTDGNGTLIDLNKAGSDVRVVFNASSVVGSPGRAIITADKVSMDPNYHGFGNCPVGVNSFCVNDDVAVIHMNADAPDDAKIYRMYTGGIGGGELITMVGYGRSGDGLNGYTLGADFRIKRSGQNVIDLFDRDDELNFSGGPNEVWYADFDGNGQDFNCTYFAVCSPSLANDKESSIGGGDSGGSTFMFLEGEYLLIGNNTFSQTYTINGVDQVPGTFGTSFGGILLNAYTNYLEQATDGALQTVPEPGSLALFGAALAGLVATSRRRRAQ